MSMFFNLNNLLLRRHFFNYITIITLVNYFNNFFDFRNFKILKSSEHFQIKQSIE